MWTTSCYSAVKSQLRSRYRLKDLGKAHVCLGLEIMRDRAVRVVNIGQSAYIEKVLEDFDMGNCRIVSSPIESNDTCGPATPEDSPARVPATRYQQAIGSLMYAMIAMRPDLAYLVGKLSQYNREPIKRHWLAVKRVLRYLAATPRLGLQYGPIGAKSTNQAVELANQAAELVGYSDSDYAADTPTRKSTSSSLFVYNRGVVSWSSKRQGCVATSTTEAEYIAMYLVAKQAKWLGTLFAELGRDNR